MGWSQQGYFGYNYGWKVEGYYTGLNPEIEKFHMRKIELNDYRNTRIFFGNTGQQFFRGYVFSNKKNIVRKVLNKFNGFLVYASKSGKYPHEFQVNNLTFFYFQEITFFIEGTIFQNFEWKELKSSLLYSLEYQGASEKIKSNLRNMNVPCDYSKLEYKLGKQIIRILLSKRADKYLLVEQIKKSIPRDDLRDGLPDMKSLTGPFSSFIRSHYNI